MTGVQPGADQPARTRHRAQRRARHRTQARGHADRLLPFAFRRPHRPFHEDPGRIAALPWIRRRILGLGPAALARTAPLIDELRAIGNAYAVTPAQVALSWLITNYGDTVVAIPGASKPQQAAESVAAMELRLTERELGRLGELSLRAMTG